MSGNNTYPHKGDYGACTDVGAVRSVNEDTYLVDPEHHLWLVADGMGGHQCGEVASAIARDSVADRVAAGDDLNTAIQTAHRNILHETEQRSDAAGMGSTIVAALLRGLDYQISWVGDSRAYLWDGVLTQLTDDHSQVRALVKSGAISEEEAKLHPGRFLLLRCLGADTREEVTVDTQRGRLSGGEELLLCSDGLTGELSDDEISEIMAESGTAQERAEKLVNAAVEHGGEDNVTVVVLTAPRNAVGPINWRRLALFLAGGLAAAAVLGALVYFQ